MQNRNRVGGIIDKRFGENDPSMNPEDKMLERFTQEKQRGHKNSSAFDLEDDETPGELTHMGQSLSLDGPTIRDDFDDEGLELSDADDHESDEERQARKRRRGSNSEGSDEDEEGNSLPERKKSKQEVMKELIAKSKMHKYERQEAKDADEDLREELDKEMSGIHELLRGMSSKPPPPPPAPPADIPGMNPERIALMNGGDRAKLEKEYDLRMRQMAQDKRSQPTERSKTEDEKMEKEARRLKELEAKRLRRMEGVAEDSDDEEDSRPRGANDEEEEEEEEEDYGLGSGIKIRPSAAELGADDEDDFIIDDDLVASGSDIDVSEGESDDGDDESDNEDDEFLKGLLTEEEAKRPEFLTGANAPLPEVELPAKNGVNGDLAYTFPCPQSHEELLEVTKGIALLDLPTVVQRIRALYHPKHNSENKGKLANFSVSLVSHISYLANQAQRPPFSVLENIIRHIHSLAKTFPLEIANAFRRHLQEINQSRALALKAGDLVVLTAIGTIFPTSDHFHQVVTPALLTMGRYIGQKIPQNLSDYSMGAYLCTLCLQYQRLSKRYVPEIVGFIENSLCALAPTKLAKIPGSFPYHEPKSCVRIEKAMAPKDCDFYDCVPQDLPANKEESLKVALLEANIKILNASADLWTDKSAFTEVFAPALTILKHLENKPCRSKLPESSQVSRPASNYTFHLHTNTP